MPTTRQPKHAAYPAAQSMPAGLKASRIRLWAALPLAAAALAIWLAAAPQAHARSSSASQDEAAGESVRPTHDKKQRRAVNQERLRIKPSATGGSQETPAQRDRRLKRECKGLPNAGACLGYAKP